MASGQCLLRSGSAVASSDGWFRAIMSSDVNLVVCQGSTPLCATGGGPGRLGRELADDDLVISTFAGASLGHHACSR
jgi:hypothetical protein